MPLPWQGKDAAKVAVPGMGLGLAVGTAASGTLLGTGLELEGAREGSGWDLQTLQGAMTVITLVGVRGGLGRVGTRA